MCYSAQVNQLVQRLEREHRARLDQTQVESLFERRLTDPQVKIARAFEANFDFPQSATERRIKELIELHRAQLAAEWEQALFAQKKRLGDAQRKLQKKQTKSALEEQRIASSKIAQYVERLAALKRRELHADDSRIFPMWCAPLILNEGGQNVIRLARYHCRPAGKPADYDARFPGLYNARRDNLEHFWREQFGRSHGLIVLEAFFENVAVHDREHRALAPGERARNVVLQFRPRPAREMLVACLYSLWSDPADGPALLSFAAVTDDPPPEVAAAGHNRCPVNMKPENVADWLAPQGLDDARLQQILTDQERPYYEHEELAA